MTLTEFLLARIAEDEAVAREAIDPRRPGSHWRWEAPDEGEADPDAPRWLRTVEEFPTSSGVGPLPAFPLGFEVKAEPARGMDHIARHDPARVLAECEAKRRIVGRYIDNRPSAPNAYDLALLDVMRDLAMTYANHPDYDEAWRA